jgi:hypothetical protein
VPPNGWNGRFVCDGEQFVGSTGSFRPLTSTTPQARKTALAPARTLTGHDPIAGSARWIAKSPTPYHRERTGPLSRPSIFPRGDPDASG